MAVVHVLLYLYFSKTTNYSYFYFDICVTLMTLNRKGNKTKHSFLITDFFVFCHKMQTVSAYLHLWERTCWVAQSVVAQTFANETNPEMSFLLDHPPPTVINSVEKWNCLWTATTHPWREKPSDITVSDLWQPMHVMRKSQKCLADSSADKKGNFHRQ